MIFLTQAFPAGSDCFGRNRLAWAGNTISIYPGWALNLWGTLLGRKGPLLLASRAQLEQPTEEQINERNGPGSFVEIGLASRGPPKHTATVFLLRFPEYYRTLSLAVLNEETSAGTAGYQGWRWDDVETHPTKLIRLVTEGIAKLNLRTRHGSYYLLRDVDMVKTSLKGFKGSQ